MYDRMCLSANRLLCIGSRGPGQAIGNSLQYWQQGRLIGNRLLAGYWTFYTFTHTDFYMYDRMCLSADRLLAAGGHEGRLLAIAYCVLAVRQAIIGNRLLTGCRTF